MKDLFFELSIEEAIKLQEGALRMPRDYTAKKDVDRLRKATGNCQSSFDPWVSEWGNPIHVNMYDSYLSEVG